MASGRRVGPSVGATSCTPIRRSQGRHLRQHRQYTTVTSPDRARADRSNRDDQWSSQISAAAGSVDVLTLTTLLTVLTVCSVVLRIRMTLSPARPSRLNVMSMPSARRNVCARRKRPASARGFLGQPALSRESSQLLAAPTRKRSAAAYPRTAVGHDFPHTSGDRVAIDNVLNRSPAVRLIGSTEGPRTPKGCFAGRGPARKISHPWQPI
jgi:hypothetical protein